MERETIDIVTPVGAKKVVLKSWLTGRERRAIRSVLLNNVNFSATPKDANQEEDLTPDYNIKGSVLEEAQDKAFETIIVSIDGKEDDVVNQVLDMRDEDFDFVVKEIDKITGNLDEESKKK